MNTIKIMDYVDSNESKKIVSEVPMGGLHPRVVNYIRHTAGVLRAPTNFVFGEVITIIGSLVGKKITVIDGSYKNRGNLYSAIVGSASGAKSPTINKCMKPLNKLEKEYNEEYERACREAKQMQEDKPPYDKQIVASNETIENLYRVLNTVKKNRNGLLFHQDELLNFFGCNAKKYSDGNIISDFLTLFEGFTPLRVGRVRMESPFFVPEPFIAILGGIQRKRVDELFVGQEHNGFFSRWQFWLTNNDSQFIEDEDNYADLEWGDIVLRAVTPEFRTMNLNFEDIKQIRAYDDEYRNIRNYLQDLDEDELAEVIMKQSYIIRRIAANIHCINALADDYEPTATIKRETVEYAAQVVEWLFTNSCIIAREIEQKRKRKISGKEAIIALHAEYGIKNQSMLSAALGGKPTQQYIGKVLSEIAQK